MKKLFFILFSLTSTQILVAQEEAVIREYINRYKEVAIANNVSFASSSWHRAYMNQQEQRIVEKSNVHFDETKTE
jgi:hypothetical protein